MTRIVFIFSILDFQEWKLKGREEDSVVPDIDYKSTTMERKKKKNIQNPIISIICIV